MLHKSDLCRLACGLFFVGEVFFTNGFQEDVLPQYKSGGKLYPHHSSWTASNHGSNRSSPTYLSFTSNYYSNRSSNCRIENFVLAANHARERLSIDHEYTPAQPFSSEATSRWNNDGNEIGQSAYIKSLSIKIRLQFGMIYDVLRQLGSMSSVLSFSLLPYSYNNAVKALALATSSSRRAFQRTWWSIPLLLIAVPIYTLLVHGTQASMPGWWPLTPMDHVKQSANASIIISMFLLSNISYFLSGYYLCRKFSSTPSSSSTTTSTQKSSDGIGNFSPDGFSRLGFWILSCGIVSTIFHAVQSLGSFAVAEAIGYVDHGLAISAFLYFWHTCGCPSRNAIFLGIAGFVALCITKPGYAFLHSLWHLLSAEAAVLWAVDGYEKQCSASVASDCMAGMNKGALQKEE